MGQSHGHVDRYWGFIAILAIDYGSTIYLSEYAYSWKPMTPASKQPPNPFFSRVRFRTVIRSVLIFVGYLCTFTALDLGSHTLEVYPGVVAWYPADGLSFALL